MIVTPHPTRPPVPAQDRGRASPVPVSPATRAERGRRADRRGRRAEAVAAAALTADGWRILATRCRTGHGEIDLVAERDGIAAFVEVKARPTLAAAAFAVGPRQRARLVAAAAAALAAHPDWGAGGVRFDLVVVDAAGRVRRIAGAFRADETGADGR